MALGKVWKQKHGLTFMQTREVELWRQIERMQEQQERAMFQAIEDEPRLLAEVKREHDAYSADIERRITSGWVPNEHEWQAIKDKLHGFAERRKSIEDPHGLKTLAKALERPKREPSVYDRYMAIGRWWR